MEASRWVRVAQVDAFATQGTAGGGAFSGNPAAVCLLPPLLDGESRSSAANNVPVDIGGTIGDWWATAVPDSACLRVANEMALSETAFLVPLVPAELRGAAADVAELCKSCTRFGLRWWTPETEVFLCGHATLGAAAALQQVFGCSGDDRGAVTFETRAGALIAEPDAEAPGAFLMRFPLNRPLPHAYEGPTARILAALFRGMDSALWSPDDGAAGTQLLFDATTRKLVVVLTDSDASRELLRALTPDFGAMVAVQQGGGADSGDAAGGGGGAAAGDGAASGGVVCGVSVTVAGGAGGADFASRYFNPWVGIDEDPANGSSHTILAPYWADALGRKPGQAMRAEMYSKRGGLLRVAVAEGSDATLIGGAAAVVLEGKVLLPNE